MEPMHITKQLKDKVDFSIVIENRLDELEVFTDIDVVVGGIVTHHVDLSQFRFLSRETEKPELIQDVYITLDDGLGTINVCLEPALYEELLLQNEGRLLGKVVAFEGQAMRITRNMLDSVSKREFVNPIRSHDYRTFANSIFSL